MPEADAHAMLRTAPYVDISFIDDHGLPMVRTVNAVVVGQRLAFHGSLVGEKTMLAGRPALVTVKEELAIIPSYFTDKERACPATSFYRSVHVRGHFEVVEDPACKAEMLAALMARFQPEGGHVPIEADHPLYQKAVKGVLVMAVPLTSVVGKQNLGQSKRIEVRHKIMEGLWQRGKPGDVTTIVRMREVGSDEAPPAFLSAPPGYRLDPAGRDEDLPRLASKLAKAYWNQGVFSPEVIADAHRDAAAWVVARDHLGQVVGSARALSDRHKTAWVSDVWVAPEHRGRGLGKAIVRLTLDHPAVRNVRQVHLMTRDAQTLYAPLGFVEQPAIYAHMIKQA